MKSKACTKCGAVKVLDLFHKNPRCRDGRTSQCKKCMHDGLKEARKDPQRKAAFKVYARRNALRRRYGIDEKQYEAMLLQQKGRCLICGKTQASVKGAQKRLHVDHCRETGLVRALLCNGCNRGLGLFSHRAGLLKRAAAYLEFFHGEEKQG